MQNRTIGILALALVAIVAACGIFFFFLTRTNEPNKTPDVPTETVDASPGEVDWRTYTSDTYGFSIEYPAHWRVSVADEAREPKINFYPPGSDTTKLPYTHHTEGVSHVSIFPKGIATEGFFGQAQESTVGFGVPVERASDFVLKDGTPFATLAFLNGEGHTGWGAAGFLFANTEIVDGTTTCMRGDTTIAIAACDPLTGDMLVRTGNVTESIRDIEVHMLESFRFTE